MNMLQPAMICNWDEYVNGFVLSLCSKVGLQKDLHTGNMCLEDDNGDLIVLDYKGKFLRFPLDCYNSLFNDWIMFDPLYNKNVMKFIFDVFIDNFKDSVYLASYYKVFGKTMNSKSRLTALLSDGNSYSTREYYNPSLQYMEIIDFLLFGVANIDYSYLDYPPPVEMPKRKGRAKK